MKKVWLWCFVLIYSVKKSNGFHLFPLDQEIEYNLESSVVIGALTPPESHDRPPIPAEWKINGKLFIQRKDNNTLAVVVRSPNKSETSEN